ncbi:hypothetical protein PGT21_004872 [Puccinia graminis f. sp. tritici]|nr:hypothetical protein PGT21_004872 [Puccinia graminis f. sp. tritici]KAA1122606.1 hypothetical protein PGTUg99_002723 [Puccinia graminis f. sp. tritici]
MHSNQITERLTDSLPKSHSAREMTPSLVEPAISKHQESYQYLCLTTHAGPQDEPHSDAASVQTQHLSPDNSFSGERANEPPVQEIPADSDRQHVCRARRLPLELRFTPVNSPTDNSGPVKPSRSENAITPQLSRKDHRHHARHCRLIGFTPLAEDIPASSSDENSTQFLGPRKVKAKEVAPCALLYKRSDVFVSSEMKSQNILAYSENHYRNLRFDDEISISEIEYAPQPTNQVDKRFQSPTDSKDVESFTVKESDMKVHLEPLCIDREPIVHAFPKDRLTSIPLTSESEPGSHFSYDHFHLFGDETESPLTTGSGAEHSLTWESPYKPTGASSDLEQSISSINSSGIQSSLWDTTLSSLTRATSPVSSIYSSVMPIYDHQLVKTSSEERCPQSECKLVGFPHLTMNTGNESAKSSMAQEAFDWEEDHGSLADDENDSDCSSIQLESDDDRELSGYTATCFQMIPSASLAGFSKKGSVVLKK